MARIGDGSFRFGAFTLSVDGKTVPITKMHLPDLGSEKVAPLSIEPMTFRFRLRPVLDDRVDQELATYQMAERLDGREMSPNELQEVRTAAGLDVMFERLMSSVRLPRPPRGRII